MQSDDIAWQYPARQPCKKTNVVSFDGSKFQQTADFELKKNDLIHKAFELEIHSGASVFVSIKSHSGAIAYYATDCSILEQVKQTPLISDDSYQYSKHCFAPDLVKSSKCSQEQNTVVSKSPVNNSEASTSTQPRIIPVLKNHHRKNNGKFGKVLKKLTSAEDLTQISTFTTQSSVASVEGPTTCSEDKTATKLIKNIPEKLLEETSQQPSANLTHRKHKSSVQDALNAIPSEIETKPKIKHEKVKENLQSILPLPRHHVENFSSTYNTKLDNQHDFSSQLLTVALIGTQTSSHITEVTVKEKNSKTKDHNQKLNNACTTELTVKSAVEKGVESCDEVNSIIKASAKIGNVTKQESVAQIETEICQEVSRKRKPSTEISNLTKQQCSQALPKAAQLIPEQNIEDLHTAIPGSESTTKISMENSHSSSQSKTHLILSKQMNICSTTELIGDSAAPEEMSKSKSSTEICNISKQKVLLPHQNTAQLKTKQTTEGLDVVTPNSKITPDIFSKNDQDCTQSCKENNSLLSKNLKYTCTMVSLDKSTDGKGTKDCQKLCRKRKHSTEKDNVATQPHLSPQPIATQLKTKQNTEVSHVTTSAYGSAPNLSLEIGQLTAHSCRKTHTTLTQQLNISCKTDFPVKSTPQKEEENSQKISRKRKLSTEIGNVSKQQCLQPMPNTKALKTKQNAVGLHSISPTSKSTTNLSSENGNTAVRSSGETHDACMTYLTVCSAAQKVPENCQKTSITNKPSTYNDNFGRHQCLPQQPNTTSTKDLHASTSKKTLEQVVKKLCLPKENNETVGQLKNSSPKTVVCPPKNGVPILTGNPKGIIAGEVYQLQQPASQTQTKEQVSQEKPFISPSVAKAKVLPCPFGHNKLDPIKEVPLKCIENFMQLPSIPSNFSNPFGLNTFDPIEETAIECITTSTQLHNSTNLSSPSYSDTLDPIKGTPVECNPSNTSSVNCFVPYDWADLKPKHNISLFDQLKMKNSSTKTLLFEKACISIRTKSNQYNAPVNISCSPHVKEKNKLTPKEKKQNCIDSSAKKTKCITENNSPTPNISVSGVKTAKQSKKALKFWRQPLPNHSIPNQVFQNWKKEIESKLSPTWLKSDTQLSKNVAKWSKIPIGLIGFLTSMKCLSLVWNDVCNRTGDWKNQQRARLVAEALSTSKIISISQDCLMSIQRRSSMVQQNKLTTSK